VRDIIPLKFDGNGRRIDRGEGTIVSFCIFSFFLFRAIKRHVYYTCTSGTLNETIGRNVHGARLWRMNVASSRRSYAPLRDVTTR